MKKGIKYAGVIAALLAVTMMLCSCKALDDMKNSHAVYTEKGVVNNIEFRGKKYTLVEPEQGDKADYKNYSVIYTGLETGWLTEPDVPVLLAPNEGENFMYQRMTEEEAPEFLTVETNVAWDVNPHMQYYCREDAMESFKKMLNEAKMDHFYIRADGWDEETGEYEEKLDLLDQKATDLILRTLNRPYDAAMDVKDLEDIPDASRKFLILEFCDSNKIFTNNKLIQIVRAKGNPNICYIGFCPNSLDDHYNENGALTDGEWRRVADKDAAAIEKLFSTYEDQVQRFYFDEDEEDW